MKEFKTSCDYVDTCYNTFGPCKHLSSIPEKTWNMTRNYCGYFNFVVNDFTWCSEKLEESKWDCYENEPLFDNARKEETCRFLLGKYVCLKQKITHACGWKQWEAFRVVSSRFSSRRFQSNSFQHHNALNQDIQRQCESIGVEI